MTADAEPRLDHDARCPIWNGADVHTGCTCRDDDGHTPRTSWADGPMCGWDLETTGPDPLTARIVTATVVRIRPGQDKHVTDWLSDVDGDEIPDGAAAVHGVTTERARAEGRPHAEVVDEIALALQLEWAAGIPIVGHNLSYDLTVLARECERLGMAHRFEIGGPVIDTIVLDRAVDKYRKGKRTLTATAEVYGIALSDEDAHTSSADALAAPRIAWKIARRYPQVGTMPLAELHEYQARKHFEWAEGFGKFLRISGKTDDVSREWPMRGAS